MILVFPKQKTKIHINGGNMNYIRNIIYWQIYLFENSLNQNIEIPFCNFDFSYINEKNYKFYYPILNNLHALIDFVENHKFFSINIDNFDKLQNNPKNNPNEFEPSKEIRKIIKRNKFLLMEMIKLSKNNELGRAILDEDYVWIFKSLIQIKNSFQKDRYELLAKSFNMLANLYSEFSMCLLLFVTIYME